jgi:hypothetical protein
MKYYQSAVCKTRTNSGALISGVAHNEAYKTVAQFMLQSGQTESPVLFLVRPRHSSCADTDTHVRDKIFKTYCTYPRFLPGRGVSTWSQRLSIRLCRRHKVFVRFRKLHSSCLSLYSSWLFSTMLNVLPSTFGVDAKAENLALLWDLILCLTLLLD